jgi:hypothetical protein
MTPEKEECTVINSSIHDDNTEESLGKRLQSVSNERDDLRKQLQSAKDEIASLNKELLRWRTAAKAAYSDMFESIKTPRGPLPSPKGESVQETLRTRPVDLYGKESDHVESEQEEEVCSQQGTDDSSHNTQESSDSAEEKNVLPSTDEEIRLRAARTLIWADSAIKRANHSSRSMESPAPAVAVPSTVHVSDVASNNSCSSATSHSRPSRDGIDNVSLLSMDNYSTPKNGPFAGIRRFLEETIDGSSMDDDDDDESLDESGLGIRDTDNDSTTPKNGPLGRIRRFLEEDNKALQNPPVSSYKYCNEAFQKLNEKNATRTFSASSPVAVAVAVAESKLQTPKPYCNQAFMKLNEKKSTAAFTMPKLFSGNR